MSAALTQLVELRPEVLVVWPETFVPSQFAIWESYFRHSSRRIAVLARTFDGKVRPDLEIPLFFEDDDGLTLRQVSRVDSIRVVLYPTVRLRFRKHINAFAGRQNVFIGHGDSDKASSSRTRNRIFDRIFVADDAARARYGSAIADSAFVRVGAPWVDGVVADSTNRPVRKVLYAPTWEGHDPDNNYSSVAVAADHLDAFDGYDVRALIHPGLGNHDPRMAEAKNRVLERFPTADRDRKAAEFNDSDAMVTDISGVLSEYLATRKPIIVVGPKTEVFENTLSRSNLREFVVEWDPAREPLSHALDRAQTPDMRAARITAAESKYRGATSSSEAWAAFDAALGAEIDAAGERGIGRALRVVRKSIYKLNPITAAKAVGRFVLRRPSRPVR